jgi:hypothetical protein
MTEISGFHLMLCMLLVSLIIASNSLKSGIIIVILIFLVTLKFLVPYLQKNVFYSVMCRIQAVLLLGDMI